MAQHWYKVDCKLLSIQNSGRESKELVVIEIQFKLRTVQRTSNKFAQPMSAALYVDKQLRKNRFVWNQVDTVQNNRTKRFPVGLNKLSKRNWEYQQVLKLKLDIIQLLVRKSSKVQPGGLLITFEQYFNYNHKQLVFLLAVATRLCSLL